MKLFAGKNPDWILKNAPLNRRAACYLSNYVAIVGSKLIGLSFTLQRYAYKGIDLWTVPLPTIDKETIYGKNSD